ncbi:DUF1993 family protein [Aquabacterium sp.]|jgi:hypothetical protein|uniref:DUF1993 domain-containing protein n=1 Tax=Aquabacterium sp. TaxID=1872578 RepID=UPI0025BF2A54|nr:DUF1993 domain-containing protein [Aquabacterium sp.]
MSLSMHSALVPPATRTLQNLATILGKAQAHCQEKGLDAQAFLQARLFPDMFPLVRQVQIACDMVKGGAARLAGQTIPSFPDDEASFAELQARIERTIAFLNSFEAPQIDGSEGRDIVIPLKDREVRLKGQAYLTEWVLPNFYFHVTTTYGLLRHNGVALGKRDFLGG